MTCPSWPVDPACLPVDWDADALDPDQAAAVAIASRLLKAASGGWWGPCPVTVRPCSPARDSVCSGPCGCGRVCRVWLDGPVAGIITVTDGPNTVPASAYQVMDAVWLVRQDGHCFPACQDLSRPLGEPGTWSVTYLQGWAIDAAASRAVTALAVAIYRTCAGDGDCALDPRTTRVTRGGTTYDLTPQSELGSVWLADPIVAAWLSIVNPRRITSPLTWWSPDIPASNRQHPALPVDPPVMTIDAYVNGMDVTVVARGDVRLPMWIAWGDQTVTVVTS